MPSPGRAGGKIGTFADERIEVGGKQRAYRLVVPRSAGKELPVALVFAFHGLGDSKDLMPRYSQLDRLAEDKGFVLVYPNATGAFWPLVVEWARDDLAFFDGLYERLTSQYNIDRGRVYLLGTSNGAYFAHVIASQRSDRIAAIAAHSGGIGLLGLSGIHVKNKYAVLVVHGDKDSIVGVEEGRKTRDAYQKWGHPVEYVELPGHNHFWAAKEGINERIWRFFESHPRR